MKLMLPRPDEVVGSTFSLSSSQVRITMGQLLMALTVEQLRGRTQLLGFRHTGLRQARCKKK